MFKNNNEKVVKTIMLLFIARIIFYPNIANYLEIDNQYNLFENDTDFSNYSCDIKTIALYLPQFHYIKENDIWWGKNFTEWTNVRKAKKYYDSHHQPRIPGDEKGYLGYYFLDNPKVFNRQVKLAKSHGIYGFAFYYYWFSGYKLLEKPLQIYLNNKNINFPFMLIWANENWSRNWDGKSYDVLMKQEYKESDPKKFINDIIHFILDKRYITIKNKPILGVYRPLEIPNFSKMVEIWKKEMKSFGIDNVYILACKFSFKVQEFIKSNIIDAVYDFPPIHSIRTFRNYNQLIYYNHYFNIFYNHTDEIPLFRGSMIEWDNSPRRGKKGMIVKEFSPEKFYMLNKLIIQWTRKVYQNEMRFIFINAWNEWGEGSYLEPDEKYGYASINALSKALFNLPYLNHDIINMKYLEKNNEIAIQAHIFNLDLLDDIIKLTNNIPVKFDLFISFPTFRNKTIFQIEDYVKKHTKSNKFYIREFKDQGRDIFPFLIQLQKDWKNYKYICHIYSKDAIDTSNSSQILRQYLLNNLLGNKEIILENLSDLENYKNLGFIFPDTYLNLTTNHTNVLCSKYRYLMNFILSKIFPKKSYKVRGEIIFPHGNMFWAKISSIYQIFDLAQEEFLINENGKSENKIILAIERIWLFIVKINGYNYKKIFKYI